MSRSLSRLDRGLYALFSRHADSESHERDRRRYRAAGLTTSFDVFIARVYGLAWALAVGVAAATFVAVALVPSSTVAGFLSFLGNGLPVMNRIPAPAGSRPYVAFVLAVIGGGSVRWLVIRAGGVYLGRIAALRREEIGGRWRPEL